MVKLDIDVENGGMTLDENFLVDFGADKNEILLAHELRYVDTFLFLLFLSLSIRKKEIPELVKQITKKTNKLIIIQYRSCRYPGGDCTSDIWLAEK